ncbi:protein kinase [Rhodococcus hoagii]|nr:protein kinase [Prescottella equi]
MASPREYKKIETIGSGAQGIVWRALSPSGESVAYKVYRVDPTSSDPATDRKRFASEIRTQSTLSHPNIVSVIEDGIDVNGDPFYVMALSGGSLQTRIDKAKDGLSREFALAIFEKICLAMAYAHSQGVLHRDLKPQNILMYGDEPRVADFGLGRDLFSSTATYTQSRLPLGSIGYWAPEQQEHGLHEAKQPADVYAMGKILYHMLTGSKSLVVELGRIPADLQYIVYSATNSDPDQRIQDCNELLNRLRDVMNADPSSLASPADQAKAALNAVMGGDVGGLEDLCRVLLSYPDDSSLYMQFLPRIPKSAVLQLVKHHPESAKKIVEKFDAVIAENTSFAYADVIADFLDPVFRATHDIALRRLILVRLLDQGYSNNRYHVGEVFASLCQYVWSTAIYAQIIADVLKEHPRELAFVKSYLLSLSVPPVVANILT